MDEASLAQGQYIAAILTNDIRSAAVVQVPSMRAMGEIDSVDEGAALDEAIRANDILQTEQSAGAFARDRALAEESLERFDAIEVTAELSSPVPLNNPYVLVVARYQEPKAKPGTFRNWIYAESVPPITSEPQRFRASQIGLPPGYTLEDYRIHVFNRGEEVATNVSAKRLPLTTDEALEYLRIDYIGRHKGETRAAALIPTVAPADLGPRLRAGEFAQPFYIKVGVDGRPGAIFTDEDCAQPSADGYVAGVVARLQFYPALEKGKPVAAVSRLHLRDLRAQSL